MQCQVTKDDVNTLMGYLDIDGSGTVDMNEFLIGIRGKPNQRR